MAESSGQERLPDPDRAQDKSVLASFDKAQARQFVEDSLVVVDSSTRVPAFQGHLWVQMGGPGAHRG